MKKLLKIIKNFISKKKRGVKDNQELWLQALESGKYKQGQRYLKNGDKYCCLGVACEIFGAEKSPVTGEFVFSNSILPPEIVETLGLYSDIGNSCNKNDLSLAGLNDEGKSFKEIARIIRENPEIYFRE